MMHSIDKAKSEAQFHQTISMEVIFCELVGLENLLGEADSVQEVCKPWV